MKLLFHVFVVVIGTLILAGAANTAIIGSNGVLNRVAEDGVLPEWFRKPHTRYGTTSRLIDTIVIFQILTIVVTKGDVNLLGEAYAFGVVWSFSMNALSVLLLRFKMPGPREWRVPLNWRFRGVEIPVGLGLITLFLLTLACINLVTKEIATVAGVSFTVVFFTVFTISEKINKRHDEAVPGEAMEPFRTVQSEDVSQAAVNVRPGNVLVACRNPHQLDHLEKVLEKTDTRKVDIVVLSVHRVTAASSGEFDLEADQIFAKAETTLFTRVVSIAEKAGKHVELLAVAATNPWLGMVQAAAKLGSSRIVTGVSPLFADVSEQGKVVGEAWETLPQPRPSLSLEIVQPEPLQSVYFNLGPHPPRLWPEDVNLVHDLWLELAEKGLGAKLHHRDVVGVALRRLQQQLHSGHEGEVVQDLVEEVNQHSPKSPPMVQAQAETANQDRPAASSSASQYISPEHRIPD